MRARPCSDSAPRHNRPSDHCATNDNFHRSSNHNHNHNPIWFGGGRNRGTGAAYRKASQFWTNA